MTAISTAELAELKQQIKRWGKQFGFQKIGVSDIDLSQHEHYLNRWLAQHFHGSMDYMATRQHLRTQPASLVPGTIRIISARLDYFTSATDANAVLNDKAKAYISRYALGRDYHKLIRKRLSQLAKQIDDYLQDNYSLDDTPEPHYQYRAFTDSAPVLERAVAEKAGLGWIGKNTMLLHEKVGSWFFLGEIYTNLPLPVDDDHQPNRCGSCNACQVACPTNAFAGPYQLDARKCISYLTIELKTAIPESLRKAIGNRVFGCDDCQLVCPFNKWRPVSKEQDFSPRHQLDNAALIDLFAWDEETFLHKTQGSAIRRIGYLRWLRNLAVGLGNAPSSQSIIDALKIRINHGSELVREHTRWALQQHKQRN